MKIREIVQTALITAVIIILGLIPPLPLGIIPVPIVMQNLGIMLAALILGPKKGTLAILMFLGLALLGLPVLSGGQAGPAVFIGPTGGYLLGWLLTPWVMGYGLNLSFVNRRFQRLTIIWLFGVLFVDVLGALWLWAITPISLIGALATNLAFISGDTLKAIAAYLVADRLRIWDREPTSM
ncbi:BioY family transporter [Lentilactobacillus fungorum]|uniref:Biotin transporter n=1 Tax=Lentilactobacillus fungorum TaxID=2201250 RepID=A0ABQ3W0M4_9LACO|nr:biotin transporter BioY [Lentilactobacillus fungorum]GHP14722.1 BioY family transporter [Lentilactobacillus fungorum]